jgi:predicted  nucleic acid-binding Zn ribbon protein
MDINLMDIWIHNEDITRKIEQWRYNWDIMGRPKFIAIWMGNYSINHCPDKSWSFLLSNLSNNKLFT